MRMRSLKALLPLLALTLAGCAGGIGANARVPAPAPEATAVALPSKAVVKLTTTGTLPTGKSIGGVIAVVGYAGGKGLSIAPENVGLSGAGTGSTLVPNTTKADRVALGLLNVNGIPAGEFATLSFDVAPGSHPTAADFSVAKGAMAIDTVTQPLAGVGVGIASVTFR